MGKPLSLVLLPFLLLLCCIQDGCSTEEGRYLLYPPMTTLQISLATVTNGRLFKPQKNYPVRRLGINLGFQVNYNLPNRLMDFYRPIKWARALIGIVQGKFKPTTVVTTRRYSRSVTHDRTDLTAGQLYRAVEEMMAAVGYQDECLEKSICELAHSPFHHVDGNADLLTEIAHFFLTPSVHRAFDESEDEQRRKYETAENLGASGADCELIYCRCQRSLLSHYTNFLK